MINIQLSERQEKIIDIVKNDQPITGEAIARHLKLTRATLRPDLAILTMSGILDARPKVGYFYTGKTALSFVSEKIKKIKVSDVKSIPVAIDEETSLYDAIVTLFLEDVSSIFVTSDGYLTGVVSRKDFLKNAIGGMDLNMIPVGVIMTRMPNIITIAPEESVLNAAIKLIDHEVDCIPVVEEVEVNKKEKKYKVIGKVSKTTITRLFVELGESD
ncbi:helix-turn-helix transcriptional regulator [Anaerosalibacter massiliensis]|uniref:Helix-turn-helix transcriptional regulator n=1 Tax=Anaerosalibacter massiliensis TaxID=1347392 RepID=A0A9X2S5U9_9FIRM|nr:helix-turn-helix transcriptional regulator [Anaerosalibacter massiliensis]MCR2044938.1 helix-turn-helix transcriptional regulator [Anaerosalibacter massiliensis]